MLGRSLKKLKMYRCFKFRIRLVHSEIRILL